MNVRWRTGLSTLLICVSISANVAGQSETVAGQQLVFVCEHGGAKSLIAAACFNKLAAERGAELIRIALGCAGSRIRLVRTCSRPMVGHISKAQMS